MSVIAGFALRGAVVAVIAFLCTWVFRLGLILPVVWLLGVAIAATVVAGKKPRLLVIPVAVLSYIVTTSGLYFALTNQETHRTFDMTWRHTGRTNPVGEAELRLEFVEFPGNFVDVYGSALRDYLNQRGASDVTVEFQVTSDLWCVRGYSVWRIDGRSAQDVYWIMGGGGSVQGSARPWGPRRWWCRI